MPHPRDVITRHRANPVLRPEQCPQPCERAYNAGIVKWDGRYVMAFRPEPLLEAEEPYETEGYRGNVIFPGGLVPEDDGTVRIYYGAADTVECLATAKLDDLLALCKPVSLDIHHVAPSWQPKHRRKSERWT